MEISVIMITHNREAFVGNMINDILNQTFCNFEFIIVDNCSMDRSGEIVNEYAKKDERIIVIHLPEEVSIGKARNIGLAHATGEFVAYVDDDDTCDRDYLEFLYGLLDNENMDFAMCGAIEERGGVIGPQCVFEGRHVLNAKQAVTELLKRERMRAGMPTKLIRRAILQKYPFKEDCRHEDIHTIYKYLAEIKQGVIAGETKYCFIRHGNNISYFTSDFTFMRPEQLEEYLQAFRERTEFIGRKFPDMEEFARYSEWSYMISMCHKIKEYGLDSCNLQLEKMREELVRNRTEFCSSEYIKDFEKEWMEKYINE